MSNKTLIVRRTWSRFSPKTGVFANMKNWNILCLRNLRDNNVGDKYNVDQAPHRILSVSQWTRALFFVLAWAPITAALHILSSPWPSAIACYWTQVTFLSTVANIRTMLEALVVVVIMSSFRTSLNTGSNASQLVLSAM